jgi:DNA-binding GntR family transcriptional regulator
MGNRQKKLITKSLREQVYDYLREALRRGDLKPGDPINLDEMCHELGVSRTPLREALLRLDWEGFVSVLPRRGVVVRPLTLAIVRYLYEIIGGLESAIVVSVGPRLKHSHLSEMREHNASMRLAIDHDDFERYYAHNVAFHDVPITLSQNHEIIHMISIYRQRLYDFPRKTRYVEDWEIASIGEHQEYLELLERGESEKAADFLRDVHWSFAVQEPHIRAYYADEFGNARHE